MGSRLSKLPIRARCGGLTIVEASTPRSRLLGLALLREADGVALHLPHCRSVHTFGMRFPLDIAFLDAQGKTLRIVRRVKPGRVLFCRRARSVLEVSSRSRPTVPNGASTR